MTVACSTNYKDISIEDVRVDNFSFKSTSTILLILDVKVNNPTKKKLSITDGSMEVFLQDRNVGNLFVSSPTVIAPKSNDYNKLVLNGTIKDFMALIGINLKDKQLLEQFDVEGFLKVKAGAAGKKLKIEKTNFKNLLQNFK
jgi:LEA14-like dessication related protein